MKDKEIKMNMKWFKLLLISMISFFLMASCQGKQEISEDKKEIVIATSIGDFADMVNDSIKPQLEKKGYKIKLIEYTDYIRPNISLANKDIDINVFQHKPYLDEFIKNHKFKLIPIFQVPTAPLALYPGKFTDINIVKNPIIISVPNDTSNLARALVLLKEHGFIELKDNISPLSVTVKDIVSYKKPVKLVELEAAQLPRSSKDVDFAIINGNYVISSGMSLNSNLIKEKNKNYINWAVIREEDNGKQWVKDIEEAYNSTEFKKYANQKFKGYNLPLLWERE